MKITKKQLSELCRGVNLLILDVDGVMTDGSIILDAKDNELKAFHVRDGHGIKMFMKAGLGVAIITGRRSKVVDRRAAELGIKEVYQNQKDKIVAYNEIKGRLSVSDKEIAYVGDDVVDIPVMKKAGLSVAVSDAHQDVMEYAHFVTKNKGGRAAVREVTDLILKAKGIIGNFSYE